MALYDAIMPGETGGVPTLPYPVRQRAALPSVDFSFLRNPLSGGNLWKTLATVLGGGALLSNTQRTAGGLANALQGFMGARQGALDQRYGDEQKRYTADQRTAQWQAERQAKAAALAATTDYRNRTLAETERNHQALADRAEEDRMGRLGTTLLNAIGPNDPRTVAALRSGGFDALPPYGSSPLGFVPGADTAPPPPPAYDPGSVFGARAAGTQAKLADLPRIVANADVAQRTVEPRVAHAEMAPRLDAANLTGIKTRTAGEQQRIGESRKMFPGKLEQQTLTNDLIRNGRLPLTALEVQHQQIENQFLPSILGANLDATRARTQSTLSGGGKANPRVLGLGSEIGAAAAKYNIDPAIVAGVIDYESGGNPGLKNPNSTAHGLGQFLAATRKMYGGEGVDQIAHYLSDLQRKKGSIEGALGAYGDGTASYVPNVLERASRYRTSVKAPKAAKAKSDYNSAAASAAQKFGWQGSKAEGASIVSHYMRMPGVLKEDNLALGILTPNPGHEAEFNEMVSRLRANSGRGTKPKAKTRPAGGATVFELP